MLRGRGGVGSARCEGDVAVRPAPATRSATVRRARRPVVAEPSAARAGVGPDAGFRGPGTDHDPSAPLVRDGPSETDGGRPCFGAPTPFEPAELPAELGAVRSGAFGGGGGGGGDAG